jgi:murein DD-endopeptidase MepM/ murein hydrolase activator NlpD
VVPRATTTTSTVPTTTPYQVPVKDVAAAGWGTAHAGYSATDVFAPCDAEIVSPVNGVALEVRTVDGWDPAVDDPATRGGRSIALLGDDGVRYYMAHFESIDPAILVGGRVGVGDLLGTVGQTGRASACHVHFGISPPCPTTEWSVRRGAIWPHPYLDAWRVGEQLSPVEEVERWVSDNPTACADAAAVNGG